MNFLAHSIISYGVDKSTLFGNFTGDFFKGRIEKLNLPTYIKDGLILHRKIDRISDNKDNLLHNHIDLKFGLFRGIISDIFIDHFISKNFNEVFDMDIKSYLHEIYIIIEKEQIYFTDKFKEVFSYLKNNDILYRYKDVNEIEKLFKGMSSRVKNSEILLSATKELIDKYELFETLSIDEFFRVKNNIIGEQI